MGQFIEGFFLQASLILALGAQNLFVLESGLLKRRHLLAAALCSICDLLLILLGVLGAASFLVKIPLLKIFFGILGVFFLAFYGFLKIREKPNSDFTFKNSNSQSLNTTSIIGKALAFSFLNPHAYLDAIALIGGYSTQFPQVSQRFFFGLGAAFFSFLWFFALASLSAGISRYLHSPKIMRFIFVSSGILLILLSFKLGNDVLQWYLRCPTPF